MTNKTDENFYPERLYRILFYNFFGRGLRDRMWMSQIGLRKNFSRRYIILAFVSKATSFTAENLQSSLVFSLCFRY